MQLQITKFASHQPRMSNNCVYEIIYSIFTKFSRVNRHSSVSRVHLCLQSVVPTTSLKIIFATALLVKRKCVDLALVIIFPVLQDSWRFVKSIVPENINTDSQ